MYMQQDWMMRQITVLTRYIASLILGGRHVKYELPDKTEYSASDLLYIELKELLAAHEFCRAEDLLYQRMNAENDEYLAVALDFYDRLNEFPDEILEEHNFPREEIMSGIYSLAKRCGIHIVE